VTSWVNEGAGLYSYTDASLSSNGLNVVTLNGAVVGKGRYPRIGYLTYTAAASNTSITDPTLPNSPSYVGSQVVIRKSNFITDIQTVTSQSSGVIGYSGGGYNANAGYGYFFQNMPSLCTQLGDWSYDATNKKLYMFFGSSGPSGYTVKISKIDRNITMTNTSYNTFQNIDFEGANLQNIIAQPTNHITFNGCTFKQAGQFAIWYLGGSTDITVNNCSFIDMPNNAVKGVTGANNWTVTNNYFYNTFQIPGLNMSGDDMGVALYVDGDNTVITDNTIKKTGFHAINFKGNNVDVERNFIDTFCNVKQDGGGIYTYAGSLHTYVTRTIKKNIVLHGLGALAGALHESYAMTDNKAHAIYLDDFSSEVNVDSNTAAYCGRSGIFVHNSHNINLRYNVLYKNYTGFYFEKGSLSGANVTGVTNANNIVFADAGQYVNDFIVAYGSFTNTQKDSIGAGIGTFTNNHYASTLATSGVMFASYYSTRTFAQWKTTVASDATAALIQNNNSRFDYNASIETAGPNLTPLSYYDVYNTTYAGGIAIDPYLSKVLINPFLLPPTASSNSPQCQSSTLSLAASTISGATYIWTGPNSFTATTQNPTLTSVATAAAGTYSVTATYNGITSAAATTSVTINPTPATPSASGNTPLCSGNNLTLSASAISGATYGWTGPNGYSSTTQSPTVPGITTSGAGTYSVTASVNGCASAPGSVAIVVNQTPSAPTASSNSPVCDGSSLNLSASTISGATYAWSAPNSYTATSQNPTITGVTTTATGTYLVTATVNGCTSASGSTSVVVNPIPTTPTISSNSPVSAGNTLTLSASSLAGSSYAWAGPYSFASNLQSPSLSGVDVINAGTYSVTATLNGCTSPAATTNVTINSTSPTPSPIQIRGRRIYVLP
jgi:parallel beta-helix repeat protein